MYTILTDAMAFFDPVRPPTPVRHFDRGVLWLASDRYDEFTAGQPGVFSAKPDA